MIDEFCRSNVPHILAIGDVTAKLMLAHAARPWASLPLRRSPARKRCR
jgi:pyruvate/2-oxoglutarate dehydrogenase complex dihydrolipoamide dehydrogenase (E3) component